MVAALNTTCEKAWFGWPCDEEVERLKSEFARSSDREEQKKLAEQIQKRAYDLGVFATLGEYRQPTAYRAVLEGVVHGPVPVFWNITKSE